MKTQVLSGILDVLEKKEAKLLSWGVTNVSFSEEELIDIIDGFIGEKYPNEPITTNDLKKALIEGSLIFPFSKVNQSSLIYRTRSAETIRLINHLKQIMSFPRQATNPLPANWQGAPDLVADYRYSLRPRRFPVRTKSKEVIFERLKQSNLFTIEYQDILHDLLRTPTGDMALSDFQVEAIATMLSGVKTGGDKGMIITAGTGSGKTYGFYLPAMMHVVKNMQAMNWVQAISLYPRKELLKDQFTTAYKLALKVASTARKYRSRSLSIGAYFGSTPYSKSYLNIPKDRLSKGWLCPFIKCPECDGDLYWLANDIQKDEHRLTCSASGCNHRTPNDDILKLTRERISNSPPDILFTTTETLNRLMSDAQSYHIIGLGKASPPGLVLLDEVHTYAGIHGAQVANLIRRWKHAIGKKIHFTGLSATLENATNFFAEMIAVPPNAVVELKPLETEEYGMEYLLALRGDPVSGTALLSTTIQTIMLMRRVLETKQSSKILYGKKVFAFTDDLDVTNRLYHNLLDAEGYRQGGNGKIQPTFLPLAAYRSTQLRDDSVRFEKGQSWRIAERIGHDLNKRLTIGRTSSQDAGVNFQADVVIATASLEVGYDDDQVGVVIQHKTPRDVASFLQRKGRAGRDVHMRPWTVITLSDYGRDRLTYQSYEQLFSPVLPERNLPVRNRYVLRIQAALTLLDWLTQKLDKNSVKAKLWRDLIYDPKISSDNYVRKKLLAVIKDLLKVDKGESYFEFTNYLSKALLLEEDDLHNICWEQPRPLMVGVLPTLYRQLESNWKLYPQAVDNTKYPLSEFIPSSLFSDLNVPEVEFIIDGWNDEDDTPVMSIEQALKEFAPGKVSRRFGIYNITQSHWLPISGNGDTEYINVDEWYTRKEFIGEYIYRDKDNQAQQIECFRPLVLKLETLDANGSIKPTSNSFLEWRTHLQLPPGGDRTFIEVPSKSYWSRIIPKIGLFTHQNGKPLLVSRFSIGSNANLKLDGGEEVTKYITFVTGENVRKCGLGFTLSVDGLCFLVKLPEDIIDQVEGNEVLLRGIRISYLKKLFIASSDLDGIANDFQKDWLVQGLLAAIVMEAVRNNITIKEAYEEIISIGIGKKIKEVFIVLFESDSDTQGEELKKNHELLVELCDNESVISSLMEVTPCLWQEYKPDFVDFINDCFLSTIGAALLDTIFQLTPNFSTNEILLDIERSVGPVTSTINDDKDYEKIWITEKAIGGGGIIENVCRKYEENPQQFFVLLESALQASDFELADLQLQQVLNLLENNDQGLKSAVENVRVAVGYKELDSAHTELHHVLLQKGILTVNAFYSSLNVRVLRDGSDEASDDLLISFINAWRHLEESLQLDIEPRLFAYIASQQQELQNKVKAITNGNNFFGTIYGLIWPRGHMLRTNVMKVYSPFQSFAPADRLLLTNYIYQQEVKVNDPNWLSKVSDAICEHAEVRLVGEREEAEQLKDAILTLQRVPIEIGVLFLYPQVLGISHEGNKIKVKLTLPENVY